MRLKPSRLQNARRLPPFASAKTANAT